MISFFPQEAEQSSASTPRDAHSLVLLIMQNLAAEQIEVTIFLFVQIRV
jgi:hypothetical protein